MSEENQELYTGSALQILSYFSAREFYHALSRTRLGKMMPDEELQFAARSFEHSLHQKEISSVTEQAAQPETPLNTLELPDIICLPAKIPPQREL